jgi:hypothetical protein
MQLSILSVNSEGNIYVCVPSSLKSEGGVSPPSPPSPSWLRLCSPPLPPPPGSRVIIMHDVSQEDSVLCDTAPRVLATKGGRPVMGPGLRDGEGRVQPRHAVSSHERSGLSHPARYPGHRSQCRQLNTMNPPLTRL